MANLLDLLRRDAIYAGVLSRPERLGTRTRKAPPKLLAQLFRNCSAGFRCHAPWVTVATQQMQSPDVSLTVVDMISLRIETLIGILPTCVQYRKLKCRVSLVIDSYYLRVSLA